MRPAPGVRSGELYARAEAEFHSAILYKPRDGDVGGLEAALAPLIVQEIDTGGAVRVGDRFGAASLESRGAVLVDTKRPTVYAATGAVSVDGRTHDQVVYWWWYPAERGVSGTQRRAQGIRVTVDQAGFPAVYEVLRPEADNVLVFVSQSLEHAATAHFGPPPAGRRFSVERSVAERAGVTVVRTLDDGPQPMGPIVYLTAGGRAVATIICRCMPSQVRQISETIYYDLVPVGEIRAPTAEQATGGARRAQRDPFLPPVEGEMADPGWLARSLRLPSGF